MRSLIDRFRPMAALQTGRVFFALAAIALPLEPLNAQRPQCQAQRSTLNTFALSSKALCPEAAQTGPAPRVRVDYFEAERSYTVRHDDVVLLCVVRNVGGVALPDKMLRLH